MLVKGTINFTKKLKATIDNDKLFKIFYVVSKLIEHGQFVL